MLDLDLAEMYQIEIRKLRQATKRNLERFPQDFMFQLTKEEYQSLQSNILLKRGQHTKHLPFVFTEQGVAMLSSVLHSDRAIQVNIAIMRSFVQMRRFIEDNKHLLTKVQELENTMEARFAEQDDKTRSILDAIKQLILEDSKPKRPVGFQTE